MGDIKSTDIDFDRESDDYALLRKYGFFVERDVVYKVVSPTEGRLVLSSSVIGADHAIAKAAHGLRLLIGGRACDGRLIPPEPFNQPN